jgi:hypothetical protein
MKLTKSAAVALNGSIKKWQKIVTAFKLDPEYPVFSENGSHNCPLCVLYNPNLKARKPKVWQCSPSCPVKKMTGKDFCEGSPYDNWDDFGLSDDSYPGETAQVAKDMLGFLVSIKASVTAP